MTREPSLRDSRRAVPARSDVAGRLVYVVGDADILDRLIGGYIHQYELNGMDRARYGTGLFEALAERLHAIQIPNCKKSRLYRYRDFYTTYPQIVETASPQLAFSGQDLVSRLSFSHLAELIEIDDPLKRAFYEVECIRGNWSVRQLKRQLATLYFERSGLSRDKDKLAAMVQEGLLKDNSPYGVWEISEAGRARITKGRPA